MPVAKIRGWLDHSEDPSKYQAAAVILAEEARSLLSNVHLIGAEPSHSSQSESIYFTFSTKFDKQRYFKIIRISGHDVRRIPHKLAINMNTNKYGDWDKSLNRMADLIAEQAHWRLVDNGELSLMRKIYVDPFVDLTDEELVLRAKLIDKHYLSSENRIYYLLKPLCE